MHLLAMWVVVLVVVKLWFLFSIYLFFFGRNPFVSVPPYEVLEGYFSYKPALLCQAAESQETKAPKIL